MKGFIIFNNQNGSLVFSKYYTQDRKLSKTPDRSSSTLDGLDPIMLSS